MALERSCRQEEDPAPCLYVSPSTAALWTPRPKARQRPRQKNLSVSLGSRLAGQSVQQFGSKWLTTS